MSTRGDPIFLFAHFIAFLTGNEKFLFPEQTMSTDLSSSITRCNKTLILGGKHIFFPLFHVVYFVYWLVNIFEYWIAVKIYNSLGIKHRLYSVVTLWCEE